MIDCKGLIYKIRGAAARWEEEHPIVGVGQMRYCDALRDAANAIEQICTDVARLEAENRAKEQYIADTISKVIRERDAEVGGMCIFRITGFESSESWERYQYSSDAPVDMTVFAKSKKEAIEKAEKILGCPISTTHRHIVVQEIEHETECCKTFVNNKYWLKSHDGSIDDAEYYPHCRAKMDGERRSE